MPSIRIKTELNDQLYFLTFTIKNWYYILDRHNRFTILLDSLKFCQKNKGLQIYAWVFMINHIHLIVKSADVSGFVRDFKKHTAFELIKNLNATEPSVATLFTGDDNKYQLWQPTNMPKLIEQEKYFFQKKNYIENNPVRRGYVALPEHWVYSSAFIEPLIKLATDY